MTRLALALTLLLGLMAPASAQQWLPGGQGVPIACAYSSSPPTVASGLFVYVQCNSSGQFVLASGSGTGANINLAAVGGVATSPNPPMVAVSVAPVTATNQALVVDLRPDSPGIITLGQTTKSGSVSVTFASDQDPCSYAIKSSVAIAVSSATTTSLVAVSGSTTVYICGFDLAIAGSATTANSAQLEYGTGASCSSPVVLTGKYGSNDAAVSTTPTVVSRGSGNGTVLAGIASNGICILTAGNAPYVEGSLTYVQQ